MFSGSWMDAGRARLFVTLRLQCRWMCTASAASEKRPPAMMVPNTDASRLGPVIEIQIGNTFVVLWELGCSIRQRCGPSRDQRPDCRQRRKPLEPDLPCSLLNGRPICHVLLKWPRRDEGSLINWQTSVTGQSQTVKRKHRVEQMHVGANQWMGCRRYVVGHAVIALARTLSRPPRYSAGHRAKSIPDST
jgi:hypothetical protein